MRVISLTCSNTEIVSELGMARHLVAVDDHSDWPESVVDGLTRVGPDLQIDADAVAALEPDLVLASLTVPGHERVVEAIERRGLPFIAPSPESLDDVFDDITLIGELLGAEAAASTLLSRMKSAFAGTDSPGRDRPNILIQWWPKPVIAPGRRSWVTGVLEAAGARGILSDEDVRSRPLTDEEVALRAPDAIVLSWCGVDPAKYRPDVVYRNPVFQDTPALRNGHVFCVPEAHLGRPGPRLVHGLRDLQAIVREVGTSLA